MKAFVVGCAIGGLFGFLLGFLLTETGPEQPAQGDIDSSGDTQTPVQAQKDTLLVDTMEVLSRIADKSSGDAHAVWADQANYLFEAAQSSEDPYLRDSIHLLLKRSSRMTFKKQHPSFGPSAGQRYPGVGEVRQDGALAGLITTVQLARLQPTSEPTSEFQLTLQTAIGAAGKDLVLAWLEILSGQESLKAACPHLAEVREQVIGAQYAP